MRVPIPFVARLDSSGDEVMYRSALKKLDNGYLDVYSDESSTIKLRPTIPTVELDLETLNPGAFGLNDEISRIIPWEQLTDSTPAGAGVGAYSWFIAVNENDNGEPRDIFLLRYQNDTTPALTGTKIGDIDGEFQCTSMAYYYDRTYAEGDMIFICAGDDIWHFSYDNGVVGSAQLWSTVATTDNSGITALGSNIIAVAEFRGYIVFTDGDLLSWSELNEYKNVPAINVAGADVLNDRIVNIVQYNGELVVLGQRTIEFWQVTGGSGASALAPIVSGTIEMGCAPVSGVVVFNDSMYFVNNRYEVTKLTGRSVQNVSQEIDKDLNPSTFQVNYKYDLSAFTVEGEQFLCVRRKTNESSPRIRTWAMNIKNGTWSEWFTGTDQAFGLATTSQNTGLTVGVSGTDNRGVGRVFLPSTVVPTETVNFEINTAFVDHGTYEYKRPHKLFFRILNGTNDDITLSYRDNDTDSFKPFNNNISGDPHISKLVGLSKYRTRQYRIAATPTVDIAIGTAEEELTNLEQ